MKQFNLILAAFCLILLTACTGSSYQDNYRSPWNMAQTSDNLQQAESQNRIQRVEPQIDWQDSRNIQTSLETPTVTEVERKTTYTQNQTPAAVPVAGAKVKVALLAPLSGDHQAIGNALLNAAQLALFDVGSENFELVPRDTKGTPAGAQDAARAAVNDGANLILGPLFSESVSAIKPIARSGNVPIIAFSTDWNVADQNTYVMGFLPFTQVARVTNYAVSRGYDRVALFAPEGQYGTMVKQTIGNVLSSNGTGLVKQDIYPVSTTDLSARLAAFTENDRRAQSNYQNNALPFNALMLPIGGQPVKTLSSYLGQYHVDTDQVKLIGTGLWDDASLAAEPMMHGAWFAAPEPRLRQNFERNYASTYGGKPPRIASLAYDGTALAAILAQSAAGTTASNAVYTNTRLTSPRGFAGIDGIFRFRADGLVERGLAVQEITRSGIRVIDPAPNAFLTGKKS